MDRIFKFYKNKKIGDRLQNLYAKVGSGTCRECTACCSESVNTFYAEYLAIVQKLARSTSFENLVKKVFTYYATELVVAQKCPLLKENGHCAVYEVRPLPCRIFGHLSQKEYEENYEETLEANKEAVSYMKEEFNITIPKEVYEHKVPYCKNFTTSSVISLEERDELIDELFMIDSLFLSEGLLSPEQFNLSMVQWFAYDILGPEAAQELRLTVSKEISEGGESKSLQLFLDSDTIKVWCEKVRGERSSSS